jgi:hypothetical protein
VSSSGLVNETFFLQRVAAEVVKAAAVAYKFFAYFFQTSHDPISSEVIVDRVLASQPSHKKTRPAFHQPWRHRVTSKRQRKMRSYE